MSCNYTHRPYLAINLVSCAFVVCTKRLLFDTFYIILWNFLRRKSLLYLNVDKNTEETVVRYLACEYLSIIYRD